MYDYLFKYVVIGDTGIGKSCLVQRYTENKFNTIHDMTIGVEFGVQTEVVDGLKIKTQIWDTAGQEVFNSITRNYYRSAAGVILCYDPNNRTSFNHVWRWIKDIKEFCPKNISVILVSTKSDAKDKLNKVTKSEGEKLAKDHGYLFIETSSKFNENVKETFIALSTKILKDIKDGTFKLEDYDGGVKLPTVYKTEPAKKKCCS